MKYTLGFLGAGNMAEAIARAAIEKGVVPAEAMIASDPSEARRGIFSALGIAVTADNSDVISQSTEVLIAVKPQVMAQAAADIAKHGRADQILISIMAGITSQKLSAAIGRPSRVIRVMPNTPLMAGAGMAGVSLGSAAQAGDEKLAMSIFAAGGEAIMVDEKAIDAITAISGSGPAYVFYLAEAMQTAAAQLGLAEHADVLVRQTVLGAALLLKHSPDTPAELRRKVTSPGGTTEAAIKHMDGNKSQDVFVNAMKAAHQRSIELGA